MMESPNKTLKLYELYSSFSALFKCPKDQGSDMIPDDSGVGLINYFTRKGQQ